MRDLDLVKKYRIFDKECALFENSLYSNKDEEGSMFVPAIENKQHSEKELQNLMDRAELLESPDGVFELVKNHYIDFLNKQELRLKGIYERPANSLQFLYGPFMGRPTDDPRKDSEKAQDVINKLNQVEHVWKGLETWIDNTQFLYLQEFISVSNLMSSEVSNQIDKIQYDFPNLGIKESIEVARAYEKVGQNLKNYVDLINKTIEEKGLKGTNGTTEEDIIKLDESYYRNILWNEIGVNLDEIISWHEDEINKTRAAALEIASKLNIPDKKPTTMAEVNEVLLKYAGPCDTPEEMFRRANEYINRAKKAAKEHVWLPEDEICDVYQVPNLLKISYPWGGYGGGYATRRPIQGHMFLNDYNFKAVTDGWIKMNTVHEAYPGHHVQYVRAIVDPLPETVKRGAKDTSITEGTPHRSEKVFEYIFEEDQFYPLFVAYRRHHTAVRIKADLMLRYFGRPIGDAVQLYVDELGFDRATARGQVTAQESMTGYFTSYYYGYKKLVDWEKEYKYEEKAYTEMLFSAGRISLENFEKLLKLSKHDQHSYFHDFASLIQFK